MAFAYRIVHAIAGRTRFRVPILSRDPEVATQLVSYLCAQTGITTVSITPACDSMVVYTEPGHWTAATLGQCLTTLSPDTLRAYHVQYPAVWSAPFLPASSWLPMSLASLAVAASALSAPVMPLLVPLLLGAAWPLFTRAISAVTQRQFLTADLADATATTLLVWHGQWLPAAALLWLEHCSQALHHTARHRATQTLPAALTTAPQRDGVRQHDVAALTETSGQDAAVPWGVNTLPGRAVLASAVGLVSGDAEQAAAVLVVDHATGRQRVTSVTALATMAQAARRGILIASERALEVLAPVDAVVFDTALPLMQGTPEVNRVVSYRHQFSSDQILAVAAALQQHNPHPVAQAIVGAAAARFLDLPDLSPVVSSHVLNVEARREEMTVSIGTDRLLEHAAIVLTQRAQRDVQRFAQRSIEVLYVVMGGRLCGLVAYTDPWRLDTAETMQALQEYGIREIVVLAETPAAWSSGHPLSAVRFDPAWSPEEKVAALRRLHDAGYTVAVVSAGRDAMVQSAADVSIVLQDDMTMLPAAHVIISRATQVPLILALAHCAITSGQQRWHSMTVANTLALVLASTGGIGPLGALALGKGVPLLALGRVVYAL